jgi:hypothetical protein
MSPVRIILGRFQPTQDQRPETERIADTDDVLLVEDGQRVGALHQWQNPLESLDRVAGRVVGQKGRQQFGVCRGR